MNHVPHTRAQEIIHAVSGKTIAVIGDVMLDRYFTGSVTRVSPEAPVPVIDIENESFHLGGAANVAHNLKSLGAEPLLCGVVGNDTSGKIFLEIIKEMGMLSAGMVAEDARPTTVKTRIIGNNQQIARLDREVRTPINSITIQTILQELEHHKDSLSAIIFEDYNKGVLTPELIHQATLFANSNGIKIFVDPKFDNFFSYRNSTVFKPNRKEAQEALGYSLKTKEDIHRAGVELLQRLDAENILLTLGAQGMMLFDKSGRHSSVPTFALHVADVSGAGDTAIATLSSAMAAGADVGEAALLANLAAGVVCGEPGVVSIKPEELLKAVLLAEERSSHVIRGFAINE